MSGGDALHPWMYSPRLLQGDARDPAAGYRDGVRALLRAAEPAPPPLVARLSAGRWLLLDLLAAAICLAVALLGLNLVHLNALRFPRWPWAQLLIVVGVAPIAVRRLWPIPVLGSVAVAVAVALAATGRSPAIFDVVVSLATYMVATQVERRGAIVALVGTEVVLGIGVLAAIVGGVVEPDIVYSLLGAAAAWFAGDAVRQRRRYLDELTANIERRRLEEVERGRQAAHQERLRIARELHDVVAHGLTVMMVQAGVGWRVAGTRPEETRRALKVIENAGRTAHDELRLMLGLLRDEEGGPSDLSPAPGLRDLHGLVEKMRAAGLPVELHSSGTPRPLSPALELSIYRIVQEGLTNVVKHAGRVPATVTLEYADSDVRVEVADAGAPSAPNPGGETNVHPPPTVVPRGLLGMQERVSAFGGTIAIGPSGPGFRVSARLPTGAA